MRFAIIPEFFIEDAADFLLFSAQYVLLLLFLPPPPPPPPLLFFDFMYVNEASSPPPSRMPALLDDPDFTHIATFILLMLCCQGYIANPYMVAKLIEV